MTSVDSCLKFDKMPTTATTVPLCSFLLFMIIKFTVWIFFVAQFRQNFFLKYFLGLWVCFCSQEISNFHNARGHYGEISPRQQLITGRNFTGCCSLWPELSKYGYTFDKFINSTRSRKLDRLPPAARQTSEKAWRVRWPLGKRSFAPEVTCVIW